MLFDATMPADRRDRRRRPPSTSGRTTAIAAAGSERFLAARGIHSDARRLRAHHLWMGVVDSLVALVAATTREESARGHDRALRTRPASCALPRSRT